MKRHDDHPVISELRGKINDCRSELLKLLDYWHFMKHVLHPQITFTYESLFGELEDDLQNKSETAQNLETRLEALSARMKREMNDNNYNGINRNKENNSNHQYMYDDLEAIFSGFENTSKIPECEVNTRYELPQIYRQLVKKLHPDINGTTEEFQKFWDNIQDAYKSQNLHRLRLFYLSLCMENDFQAPDYKTEEIALRSEIREFERNIMLEKKKIEQIKKREPFIYMDKLNDNYWIASRKRKLKDRILQIELKIKHQQRMLQSLSKVAG